MGEDGDYLTVDLCRLVVVSVVYQFRGTLE